VETGGGGAPVDGRVTTRLGVQALPVHLQSEDAVHPAEVEDDPP